MKTSALRIGTIAIALFIGIISANASNFFFDRKEINSQLVSKIKYEKNYDGYFKQTTKYDYSYDAKGRVAEIEVLTWNGENQEWQANHKISYDYNSPYAVEMSYWNNNTKKYDLLVEKIEYQIDENNEIKYYAVTNQKGKKTEQINDFELLTEK